MAKILNTIWFDATEPPDKSFLWIKPEENNTYSTYIYNVYGWEKTTQNFTLLTLSSDEFSQLDEKNPTSLYIVASEGDALGDLYLGGIKIGSGKIPEGVYNTEVHVDNTSGTPSASSTLSNGTLSISFSGLKGQKGDTGPVGPQGLSAYALAVRDTGYQGTELEWLATFNVDHHVLMTKSQYEALETIDPTLVYMIYED